MPAVRAQLWPPGNTHKGYESQPAPGLDLSALRKGIRLSPASVRRGVGSGEAWGRHRPQEMPLPAHYTLESAGTLPRVEGQKMAKRTTNFIPMRRGYPSSDA